jgi:hypothetical protein
MSTILIPIGPDRQINIDDGGGNGVTGAQQFPQIAALPDGRFAIVYQSPAFGNAADNDIIAALVNPDGSFSPLVYPSDVYLVGGQQITPAVAARRDGGFGVVFTNEHHAVGSADPNGTNITYRRVDVTDVGPPPSPVAIADFNGGTGQDALQAPAIATLQSGRQVVVFERVVSGADHDVFLNVLNSIGGATDFNAASPLVVANTPGLYEASPVVAASGENALIVYQDGSPGHGVTLYTRLFNGQTNTLGPELAGISFAQDGLADFANPAVIALDSTRYAIVFEDHFNSTVYSAIYDPAVPGLVSPSTFSHVRIVAQGASNPSLARTPEGGFIVSWTESNGTDLDVRARVFTAAGEPVGGVDSGGVPLRPALTLGTTDSSQDFSFVATSADHAFFAWQDGGVRPADGSPTGVRGMSFLMVNAAHSDFNADGVDDVLWQHSSGQVAEWQMSAGQIAQNSAVATVAGSWHFQGLGDFDGDARSDALWRNDSGQAVLWTMNGASITNNQSVAVIGNDWHNEGVGDFSGDGRADVLWRNDSGQVALWTMSGASITRNQTVANISSDWHNQGVGDFNADGHADVLWRNVSGQVVLWQMNGASIVSNQAVANLGLDWHVLGTGDFNADGRTDVLLQHNGGQVVMWQMNGSSIVSNQAVMSGQGAAVVGHDWHLIDIADYTGDGRADVLWRNDSSQVAIWEMNGANISSNHAVANIALDYAPLTHHYDLI